MNSQNTTVDWLEHVTLEPLVQVEVPDLNGSLVAIEYGHDSEFGNPAWVYRFEFRASSGAVKRLGKGCLCMGQYPRKDLRAGFRAAYGKALALLQE